MSLSSRLAAEESNAMVVSLLFWSATLVQSGAPPEPAVFERDHEFDRGSNLEIAQPTSAQVQDLALLAKVWGFLKYHHPRITHGELHWDYELIRVLPRVLDAADLEATTAALLEWIEALPPLAECAPCAPEPVQPYLEADLAWIHDRELLGDELSARLENIHRNRHATGAQFYVGLAPNVENPQFTNELPYAQFKIPDAGFRILALFRYWNIIRYWFPARDLIDEDWDHVLADALPRFIAARDPDRYRLELIAIIARVHDTHANLWSSLDVRPPRGMKQLPVVVRFIESMPVITGYSHADGKRCGLEVGDVILALDGVPVKTLVDAWRPFYAVSNEPTMYRDMARDMTRGDAARCRVRIEREGQPIQEIDAERMPLSALDARAGATHDVPGDAFRLLSPDVAYLKLSSVKGSQTANDIRRASKTRGLVIDIRNYPSEFVVFALGQHLVAQPAAFARFTHGDLGNPGAFVWTEPVALQPQEPHYGGKVVILVDEVSQSQAEYTAMAFRTAPGAVVVGSTTAGADGNVSTIPLPGGLSTMISGLGVFYPDKRPTQRVGIIADVIAQPTVAGIRAGRDEVLEVALRQILGDQVPGDEVVRLAKH